MARFFSGNEYMVDFSKRCVKCNGEYGHTSSSCKKPYYQTYKEDTFICVAYDISNHNSDSEIRKLRVEKRDANGVIVKSWVESDYFRLIHNQSNQNKYWVTKNMEKMYMDKIDYLLGWVLV